MAIVNLTQHAPTPEQVEAGVGPVIDAALPLLNFQRIPRADELQGRAEALATLAEGEEAAMIGGAPYLMGPLEVALKAVGVKPLYAFTMRQSVEEAQPDGTVKKTQVFKHTGFVEA
jgi:hypothetical protein